jgi:hypothetical protein
VADDELPMEIPPITERSFSVFLLPHFGHGTILFRSPMTISSNLLPHSVQWYSNISIMDLLSRLVSRWYLGYVHNIRDRSDKNSIMSGKNQLL